MVEGVFTCYSLSVFVAIEMEAFGRCFSLLIFSRHQASVFFHDAYVTGRNQVETGVDLLKETPTEGFEAPNGRMNFEFLSS